METESGGKAFAPLGSSCTEYGATATGGHTGTETVSSGSLQEAGLKSTFHDVDPSNICSGSARAAAMGNKSLTKEGNCNFSFFHKQAVGLSL